MGSKKAKLDDSVPGPSGVTEQEKEAKGKFRAQIRKTRKDKEKLILKESRLLKEYQEKYKVSFDDENDDDYDESKGIRFDKLSDSATKVLQEPALLPSNHHGCQVCGSRKSLKFSDTYTLCHVCLAAKSHNNTKDNIKCKCNPQILDMDLGVLRQTGNTEVHSCIKCRLSVMKKLLPTYYPYNNLIKSDVVESTQEGGVARFMDLSRVTAEWFNNRRGQEAAAILVRAMNFSVTDRRQIVNVILRVYLSDPRWEKLFGLDQLLSFENVLKRFQRKGEASPKPYIVDVDRQLIDWSPANFWTARIIFYCTKLVEFLINPLLNSDPRQTKEARVFNVNLRTEPDFSQEYFELALRKRGVSTFTWFSLNPPLPPPVRLLTKNYVAQTKKDYMGNIYGTFFASGRVGIGKTENSLNPRYHAADCLCLICQYIRQNKEEAGDDKSKIDPYIKVILFMIERPPVDEEDKPDPKDNEETRKEKDKRRQEKLKRVMVIHEASVGILFAFAKLKRLTLQDVVFPFEPQKKANSKTWPGYNIDSLPNSQIQFMMSQIEAHDMDRTQLETFKMISSCLFNREWTMDYKWTQDPLRHPLTVEEEEEMELQ